MAENTESKMLERFNTLIGAVTPMGAAYNPPQAIAAVTAMNVKAAAAQAVVDALDQKEAEEDQARNERKALYDGLAALGSDIYQYSKALGWNADELADLQSKVRELRGGRAEPKPVDDPNTPEDESQAAGSASQRSYASLEGHWSEIVAFLTEKGYTSNETGLELATLTTRRDNLRDANINVANKDGAAAQGRQQRDAIFYTDADSIVNSARASKNYLRAVHDDSQAWAAVRNLEFELPPRLR